MVWMVWFGAVILKKPVFLTDRFANGVRNADSLDGINVESKSR
jgi:hypothetical protein